MPDLKLAWRRSSPNYFNADFGPATVEVRRSKTWKRDKIERPWHVGQIFGRYVGGRESYAAPEAAMAEAENAAVQMAREIAEFLEKIG